MDSDEMISLSVWQTVVPDSLLVEIFGHLDIRALGRVAQVCVLWKRIAQDEILWRNLARKCLNIKGMLRQFNSSWKAEVQRLTDHVPTVESENYEIHQDQVLDVAISHNGQYFCTTSKDVHATLWQLAYPSSVLCDVDVGGLLSWELTQYSSFNESDTLVFVCGVALHSDTEIQAGRGAVFTVPDMKLVCAIKLDPPTLFGAWLTDRMFIGGSLTSSQDLIKIENYKVTDEEIAAAEGCENSDCDISVLNKTGSTLFIFQGHQYHQMNLLVATLPESNTDNKVASLVSLSPDHAGSFADKCELSCASGTLTDNYELSCASKPVRVNRSLDLDEDDFRTDKVMRDTNKDLSSHPGIVKGEKKSNKCEGDEISIGKFKSNKKCKLLNGDLQQESQESLCISVIGTGHGTQEKVTSCNMCGSGDIQTVTCSECRNNSESWADVSSIDRTSLSTDIEPMDTISVDSIDRTSCLADRDPMDARFQTKPAVNTGTNVDSKLSLKPGHNTYILFVTGDHDAIAVQEITADKVCRAEGHRRSLEGNAGAEKIDHYFHIKDCYLTGLCLSSDQRYLYFNYREIDQNEPVNREPDARLSEKIFSQHLRVGTIDLRSMTRLTDKEYAGHVAFSEYPSWYICLAASPHFIGSGSEDQKAYLWDRHHGILLATLQHEEGVVNGIAFSPTDEETCITVCDDKLIKVWRSKHRLRQTARISSTYLHRLF